MKKCIPDFVPLALPVLALILMLSGLAPAFEGDLTGDGCIDWADLAAFADRWLDDCSPANNWCDGADLNNSDKVDFTDFALLGQNWHVIEPYITTLLASYETDEFPELTLGNNCDAGLTLTPILASSVGLTATDGDYILKLNIVNESDGKVEFSHTWGTFTFDLAGQEELLVDCYFATQVTPMTVIGVWDSHFLPGHWSGNWSPPTELNVWHTVSIDMTVFDPTMGHGEIWALVFEGMPSADGTIYVDNLRLRHLNPNYYDLTAIGHDSRIDLRWHPVPTPSLQGYNIYRADSQEGPFTKLNDSVHTVSVYSDFFGVNGQTYYYYITSVLGGGETGVSDIVSATSYAMTDEQLLTSVQEAVFRYFWDFAHPVSGLTRERFAEYDRDTVTTGGSGMGLMTICVGVERGFVTRAEAAERILKILTFLDEKAERYHGAWSHWLNGTTGESIPPDGDGYIKGDIVETAFMAEGLLTVRQYFDDMNDATEADINDLATELWEGIDWNWYRNGGNRLWWWWSPTAGFTGSFSFTGYTECMVAYLLAIASPTHPIPASCYYDGWTPDWYANGNTYYGHIQWVGPFEMPMFWTHYSYLGFDPRNKSDSYCNYFDNSKNIALIDRAYCNDNPSEFTGYSNLVWGLTSSYSPWGYVAHAPGGSDNGTIAPTAAISSMPYTPTESIATLKHFYHAYGEDLWGPFGFYDAFNLTEDWFSDGYLAIDQGTIVPMIENYRTQLCWDLFMANPEIEPMLRAIGWSIGLRDSENPSGVVNGLDYEYYEGTWNKLPNFDELTPVAEGTVDNFDITPRYRDDYFAFRFTGYIDVPTDGTYIFYTNSDDGSQLYIGDTLVVDNDGLHGMDGDVSGTIGLKAGKHAITVTYFEKDGEEGLLASYEGPEIPKTLIPNSVLYRPPSKL